MIQHQFFNLLQNGHACIRTISLVFAFCFSSLLMAADHSEAPLVIDDPAADIADVYLFMNPNDASEIVIVMTVFPLADSNSGFSDAIDYKIYLENNATTPESFEISCNFDSNQKVSCTGPGNLSLQGTSDNLPQNVITTQMRVFAGLRDDPFYFDAIGFGNVVANGSVTDPVTGENFFSNGNFATFQGNVLSLVIGLNRDTVTANLTAPILKVYGATTRRVGG